MANKTLLNSSLCSLTCHILAILMSIQLPPVPYIGFVFFGLGTSVWNHYTTSDIAKWIDRITMGFGVVITYLVAPLHIFKYILFVIVGSYGIAKIYKNNISHLIAHLCITCINVYIILFGFS